MAFSFICSVVSALALKVAFAETWKNAALGLGLVCPSVCVCVRVAGSNAGFSV